MPMSRQRDLLVNFERMWREMDELLGDPFAESRVRAARSAPAFAPRVDVYYCGEPPNAIVKVELAGVDIDTISLEVSGRELVITGERPVAETEAASTSRSRSRPARSVGSSNWAPMSSPRAPAPPMRTGSSGWSCPSPGRSPPGCRSTDGWWSPDGGPAGRRDR
jgi:HSP20 family molecular chaperone IbpA